MGRRFLTLSTFFGILGASLFAGFLASFWFGKTTAVTIDKEVLETFTQRVQETKSDVVLIWHNGEVIYKYVAEDSPEKFEIMSITKSIIALAFGSLLTDNVLESIEKPVCELYPEWSQGNKQFITIKNILNHTSGLQDKKHAFEEICPSPDAVQLALAAELMFEPGQRFFYSNKATNLLAGIVERLSGKRLDNYVQEKLLAPLQIQDVDWAKDPAGNPYGMAGLQLNPYDLLKIGRLIVNQGAWEGTHIVDSDWLHEIFTQSQSYNNNCGLLWWLVRSNDETGNPIIGYLAQGYLGQYLVIFPQKNLIALRLIAYKDEYRKEDLCSEVSFSDFMTLVFHLLVQL